MKLPGQQLAYVRSKDPKLAELFQAIAAQSTATELQGNTNPLGEPPVPPPPDALNVTNGPSGEFQIAITHNAEFNRGISYTVEHDTSAAFTNPHPMELGHARNNSSLYLPGQTLHFRVNAAYRSGAPSAWTYYGTQQKPKPVLGGVKGPRAAGMGSGTGAPASISGPGPIQARNSFSGYDWKAQTGKTTPGVAHTQPPASNALVVGGSSPSLIITNQAGIAGLILSGKEVVFVTDYPHILLWNGSSFSFLDDGSDYYAFSDVAAPSWSGAPNGPWIACDGSTVHYLKSDGTLGTKTLPDVVGGAYFLELGSGSGGFAVAVAGVVSGTCAVTGTVAVSSLSVSGTCAVTVSGTCAFSNGSGTTDGADASFSSPTADASGLGVSVSGTTAGADASFSSPTASASGLGVSVDLTNVATWIADETYTDSNSWYTTASGTTAGADASFSSPTASASGLGVNSSGASGVAYGGTVSGTTDSGDLDDFVLVTPDTVEAEEASDAAVTVSAPTIAANLSYPAHGHGYSASLSAGSVDSLSGFSLSGSTSLPVTLNQSTHDHTYSTTISGSVYGIIIGTGAPSAASGSFSDTTLPVTLNQNTHDHTYSASGSLTSTTLPVTLNQSTHDHTISSITGSGTSAGSGSGTISGTGTGSGTCSATGTIAGLATGSTPAAWAMQARFRV